MSNLQCVAIFSLPSIFSRRARALLYASFCLIWPAKSSVEFSLTFKGDSNQELVSHPGVRGIVLYELGFVSHVSKHISRTVIQFQCLAKGAPLAIHHSKMINRITHLRIVPQGLKFLISLIQSNLRLAIVAAYVELISDTKQSQRLSEGHGPCNAPLPL